MNKLCVDYYRFQKGSHIYVFQNEMSERNWDSPDPANRHVLSLYSSRTILCVKSGNLVSWRGSPQSEVSCHTVVWTEDLFTDMCFKNRIIYISLHFLSPFFFFSFHVYVLKQLNLQAMLLAQRQNYFSEVKSQSGLTHRTLNWKTLCDSEKGFKGPKRI